MLKNLRTTFPVLHITLHFSQLDVLREAHGRSLHRLLREPSTLCVDFARVPAPDEPRSLQPFVASRRAELRRHNQVYLHPRRLQIQQALATLRKDIKAALKGRECGDPTFRLRGKLILDFGWERCSCGGGSMNSEIRQWLVGWSNVQARGSEAVITKFRKNEFTAAAKCADIHKMRKMLQKNIAEWRARIVGNDIWTSCRG